MTEIPAPSRVFTEDSGGSAGDAAETAFFSALHQSNGTTRMTSRGRLDDLNHAIAVRLPADGTLELLDVGVSSGVSSDEWLDSIESIGRKATLTAFDRIVFAHLFSIAGFEILAEPEGHVLLAHDGRHAFTHPVSQTRAWRNRTARAAFAVAGVLARLARAVGAGRTVELITPRLRARPNVTILEHDVFAPTPQWLSRFHAVRIANVLNRSYFDEGRLAAGLFNAANWVRPGGLLAVCRTDFDGTNHGTIFRRCADGLHVEARVGSGSEIETLALRGPA